MKKVFLLIMFFMFPFFVNASVNTNYDISVQDNGDILMKTVISTDGEYNGITYKIKYNYTGDVSVYSADECEIIKICAVDKSSNQLLNCFEEVNSASAGQNGLYTKSNDGTNVDLKIFNTSQLNNDFYIEYLLTNVVVVYNDTADLRLNIIDKQGSENISKFTATVHLPSYASEYRAWGHGNLDGETNIIDKKTVTFKSDSMKKGEEVYVRMIFDKSLVSNSEKIINKDMRQEIIDEEEVYINKANAKRVSAKIVNYGVSTVWLIGLIIMLILHYKQYDKEHKPQFQEKYFRDFPGNHSPEVVEYLMNTIVTQNGLSASLMNIVRKKGFIVEKRTMEKGIFKKETEDFLFMKNDKLKEDLTENEITLRDWFLNYFGDGKGFFISSIKEKTKKEADARAFMNNFLSWKAVVVRDANNEKFYEEYNPPIGKYVLYTLIPIALSIFGFNSFILLSIIGLIAVIYVAITKKRTKEANEYYYKYKGLKNFLNDFGNFKDTEIPEIALWEKYLVFATAFNIAEKVSKQMELKLASIENNANLTNNFDRNMFGYMHMNSIISRSLNNSVSLAFTTAITEIQRAASSKMSSSGGFGGGFSDGGGFGGGGGASIGRF